MTDILTEHGEFYSLALTGWQDTDGYLRPYCCPQCVSKRRAEGWIPLYALNPAKRGPMNWPEGAPGTTENLVPISTSALAGQTPETKGK